MAVSIPAQHRGQHHNRVWGKIPGLKAFVFILLIPLMAVTPACARRYTIHPGALNTADSAAYDTLLAAEAVIDQARVEFKANRLPAGTKAALDALIESYNVARDSWIAYRSAVSANVPSDIYSGRLGKNLTDLINAIRMFKGAK